MADVVDLIDLSGRRAVVTGAAMGIGAAIAARLAECGADVVLADIADVGEQTAAEIVASGGSARFVRCDITDAANVTDAIGDAELHILVNNAGIYPTTGPLTEATDDFVSTMLEVNVRAQFALGREGARRMSSGASIVNLASIAGLRGGAGISAYSASKGAVIALTRAFAAELGPRGIRVNAIAPGVIDTPGVHDQLGPLKAQGMDIDKIIAGNPLGIAGQPDHVARIAVFLASDLSAFVTGQTIVVDGGASI
jgi:NAD(P)-dependent dehydrogenase (short-subunit alcohol dehydrogenase family)